MSHSKLRARLNDYVDRELPGTQRAEISAHLAECRECAAELRELEHAVNLLRRLPEPELPPGFSDAVMERVRAGESEPRWLRSLRGLLQPAFTIGVTAAVAGLAVFAVMRTSSGPAPGPVAAQQTPTPQLVAGQQTPTPVPSTVPRFQMPRPRLENPNVRLVDNDFPTPRRHRRVLDLARQGHPEQVARTLRGAGHPHSDTLAAHFEELNPSDSIQLIVAGPTTPLRVSARR